MFNRLFEKFKEIKFSLFTKLIFLAIVIEIFTLIIVVLALDAFSIYEERENARKLENKIIEINYYKSELKNRRDSNFVNIYYNNTNKIELLFKQIDTLINQSKFIIPKEINEYLSKYNKEFDIYKKLLYQIGLSESEGIEGVFRLNVHLAEEVFKKTEVYNIYVDMLQARRAEKDFIMRGRGEYLVKAEMLINSILEKISKSNLNINDKENAIQLIKNYQKSFNEFVNIHKKIISKENSLSTIEQSVAGIIINFVSDKEELAKKKIQYIVPLIIISLLIGFLLAIIIAQSITKPVRILQKATLKISEGDLKVIVNVKSNDEIGDLAKFFNNMVASIHSSNQLILKQKEKLEEQYHSLNELNATKDKFFSIIAHDLKNPLGAFKHSTEILYKEFDYLESDEIRLYIEELFKSSNQVLELLENLLTWSRSQRGKIPYSPVEVPLNFIINNNFDLLKMNADKKQIQLVNGLNEEVFVYADINMISTILRNLISNAIKFTRENGTIKIYGQKYDHNYFQITVEDNGVGISPENIDKLFRIDSHYTTVGTTNEQGTGLGLIICKEFIEKHNGKIWVESQLGIGTKFHFTLPYSKN